MRKYTKIQTAIIASSVWLVGIAGGLYYFQSRFIIKNPSDQVVVYKSTKELAIGDSIDSSSVEACYVDSSELVDGAIVSLDDLKSKKAVSKINAHEQLTSSRLVDAKYDFNTDSIVYTIPVSVESTNAYGISVGEYVCLMINYSANKPSDCVVPKIAVYDLRSADGVSIRKDPAIKPAYACFLVSPDATDGSINQIRYLDDASKQGTLYMAKYLDSESTELKTTYTPSWNLPQETRR